MHACLLQQRLSQMATVCLSTNCPSFWIFYVAVVAVVVVIVDVDDESLPYGYCMYAVVCTMQSFARCTSETILSSADGACRRPVSFLRMMHHCIMAPGFQPKERHANRPQGRRHWDWQRDWFASYAILAV